MTSYYYYEPSYNFDRFFDEFLGRPQNNNNHNNNASQNRIQGGQSPSAEGVSSVLRPKMDLHENEDNNIVTATFELPGLKKEDVSIDVQDGRLTIAGESKISSENEKDGYAVRERRFGKFSRTLRLPQGVKEEEIKASLENGVLTVTFPKRIPEAAPRKIAIA